jgi:hypothetical protein
MTMNHLQQQTLEDAELVLTDQEHNYLGPDLVLKGCRVILRTTAKALTMTGVRFRDCQVEAKKKLVNFRMWCATDLQDCSFAGRFESNDFGHWEGQHSNGSIKDCDFSASILDGCRFIDCDIDSIKLPAWPCFTILYPHRHQAELASTPWPGKLEHWFGGLAWSPEATVAVVGYAPALVKKCGSTEDELRELLEELNGILIL